jgi:16S rRNA (guanine527-N7)-methyltransferase
VPGREPSRQPSANPGEVLRAGFIGILGRLPSAAESQAFERYLSLLLAWNRVRRLTSYRTPAEIVLKLFLDSLLLLRWLPPGEPRVLDLGAGAGIPGVPLKIVRPDIGLWLLEARRWRVSFLSTLVRELALSGVRVLEGRAETLLATDQTLAGGFDLVLMRAAGPLPSLVPLALEFLRSGGYCLASGPPVGQKVPAMAPGTRYRWEIATGPWGPPRQFLVVEKS